MSMDNTEKKQTFSSVISQYFQGLLIGIFSIIPFFQTKHMERIIRHENPSGFDSYFSKTLPYLLGIGFAATMMFYSPINMVLEKYSGGIYIGLLLLSLAFLAYEIYSFVKVKEKSNKDLITAAIVFVCVFAFAFGFSFARFQAPENSALIPFILLFVLSIGSFLCSCSGISPATLFFFLGIYLTDSAYMNETLYQGFTNNLFLIVIITLGIFIGNTFYRFYQSHLDKAVLSKASANIALYFAGILALSLFKIKGPFIEESGVITPTAQMIVMFATIFSFAIVGIVLTFSDYPFMKSGFKVNITHQKGRKRARR